MSYPYLSDLVRETTGISIPLPIPMFGLTVACAVLVGMWVAGREFERISLSGVPKEPIVAGAATPRNVMSDLGAVVVLAGIVGARIFSVFESSDSWNEFIAHPWATLFSRTGFAYYGGLIFGTIAGVIFIKRKALPIRAVLDAVAPAIMIGYAIGRIGCQLSGDGDWGIAADMASKPNWLPLWLWAQTYEHNIAGVVIAAPGVYPTPIYETIMSLIAFAILWSVCKHSRQSGWLFSLFLVLSGIERFLIELIRVNATIEIGGLKATQAEIISSLLVLCGTSGLILFRRHRAAVTISRS